MAKVVGKDKSALRRATCKNCASIIEYELREVNTRKGGDYSGDTFNVFYIICPNCGMQIQDVDHY